MTQRRRQKAGFYLLMLSKLLLWVKASWSIRDFVFVVQIIRRRKNKPQKTA
jgi:hypothetical protein